MFVAMPHKDLFYYVQGGSMISFQVKTSILFLNYVLELDVLDILI